MSRPRTGLPDLAQYISYGASPRGPISLVQGARALALIRGREYAVVEDLQALARDALRHRLVLSYQALAEEVTPDSILDQVLAVVPHRSSTSRGPARREAALRNAGALLARPTPASPGPGPMAEGLLRALDVSIGRQGRRPSRRRLPLEPARHGLRARDGAAVRPG